MKRINQVAKLVCNLMGVILSFLVFDLVRLGLLLAMALIVGGMEGNIGRKNLKKILPLLLFGIGMFTTSFIWGDGSLNPNMDNFTTGIKLFLRIAIIGSLAMGFLFNINPNEMLLSLMQNLRLNSGIAYGVMVAFRFFPMMEKDMAMIRAARSIRMGDSKRSMRDTLALPIPLLATNVRRAEKVAVAMEARGFDRFGERSSYREVPWQVRDSLYVAGIALIFLGIYYIKGSNGDWSGF